MLIVDLDGTALDRNGALAPVDVEAARALARAGVPVTIATGRLFTGTQWVARELGVVGSVAVMNGSELIDAVSGEVRHGRYLGSAVRASVRELIAGRPLATFLFQSRKIHYCARHARHARYLSVWTRHLDAHDEVFDAPPWAHGDDVVAIGIAGQRDDVERARDDLARALPTPEDLDVSLFQTFDGDAFLKLRHAAEDKGTALARLAAERGLEPADCVAVGDWINDLPMLRAAGRSFAMSHAQPSVCEAAGEVLVASREGGAIAEIARRVWGL